MQNRTYEEVLDSVLNEGILKNNRTGTPTLSVATEYMKYDLTQGFPLITTKYVSLKSVATELEWFLRGDTNIRFLQERGCHIWDEWADKNGDLGPMYGKLWRDWEGIDQIKYMIDTLKNDPFSRRNLLSTWKVDALPQMALNPCHVLFQLIVDGNEKVNLALYQRSADLFLGVPYNIASYALLGTAIAKLANMEVGTFTHFMGDAHIYVNHIPPVKEQISREPFPFPTVKFTKLDSIDDLKFENLELSNYVHHPKLVGKVAV